VDHHTCVVCVGAVPCDGDAECKWCAGDRDICDSCAESRAAAKERAEAALARRAHADLRTRFALALTSGALSHGKLLARDRITGNPIAYTPGDAGFVPRLYDLADAPELTAADGSPLVRCTYRRDGLQCSNYARGDYQVAGKPVCGGCSIRARTDARERAERRVYAPTSGLARYARGWR